ncbi:hypothetical protein niasHS_009297 [Heterodera schachtii]|uniref:ubiquitinyl hydrolase 1 n=2 Tax=Heterodera TaxID=34509 RepID=A0ABD2JBL5_HETSC
MSQSPLMVATFSDLTANIYNEKQKRQLCLLHTLNNLFQCEEFVREELDEICERPTSQIRKEVIVAYIFNIPSTSSPSNNLDSKLATPTLISTANGIVHYINTLLA